MAERDFRLALVLSGGNALGSYQAGAYQALHEQGLFPDWIAGASAGAINGALICGNPLDGRVAALRSLWNPGSGADTPWAALARALPENARRTAAAMQTLLTGAPPLFVPRHLFGPWWNPFGNREPASLYDATPLRETIERLADFALINRGEPRLSVTAVDVESGDDVVLDTRTMAIQPDHVRASAALMPVFSPVEVGGRLLADAGISANLPLDVVLSEPGGGPLVCIAVDLLPLPAPRPRSLGDVLCRTQDLVFATQSRRALAAWQAIFEERTKAGDGTSITVLHVAYTAQDNEVSGKGFDFSAASSAQRWQAGYEDMIRIAAQLSGGSVPVGRPGLSLYRPGPGDAGPLETVRFPLGPRAV